MKKKTIFAILLVGMCLHSDPAYATLVESGPWLTCPGHTPYTDFKDSSDWTGVYYAEGSGIELYIYSDAWEFGYVSDSKEDNTLICECTITVNLRIQSCTMKRNVPQRGS